MHVRVYYLWGLTRESLILPIRCSAIYSMTAIVEDAKEEGMSEVERTHQCQGPTLALWGRPVPCVDLRGMTRRHQSSKSKKRNFPTLENQINKPHNNMGKSKRRKTQERREHNEKSSATGLHDQNTSSRDHHTPKRLQKRKRRKQQQSNSSPKIKTR
jgi:hypothetical protein